MRTHRIRDLNNSVIAEHVRVILPNGKKDIKWRVPGHSTYEGLMGVSSSELPLYGTHMLPRLEPGRTVVVGEGEPATEALWRLGLSAVGTVTGASATPDENVLSVLLAFDVVLWPDHDQEGRDHMARVAARLIQIGGACRLLRWKGAAEKGDDAADFLARGGSPDEARALVTAAKPVAAVYLDLERPTPIRRSSNYGDDDDRKERARDTLTEVVHRRLGAPSKREGRSWFWRCPFHDEKSASFKVDLREPFFRCFGCGARGDVFSFLSRMDGRSFKETLAELAPRPYTGILGRYAE